MIVFVDLLKLLSAHGYNTNRLRKEKLLGESVIDRMRRGLPVSTSSLDVVCKLCECQPGDLMSWQPDKEAEE